MYNDPSGELFWFAALAVAFKSVFWAGVVSAAIGGAIIGTALYLGQAAITGNFSWGGLAKAFFGGALTGAVSGALGQVFSAGSFWATVGNGALTGAGSGGINSIMNGTNFLEEIAKGAVIGGAIGAVSYGLGKLFRSENEVNYEMNADEDSYVKGKTTVDNAKDSWRENWKDTYESTKNAKPAYLTKRGSIPKGYKLDQKTGLFYNKSTGETSWAVTTTTYSDKSLTMVEKHTLYLSKAALSSKEQLNYVFNHEFGHMVLNNNYGDTINTIIGNGLMDTAAHQAIQVTGSKFLQLNNWSQLNIGGVFKGTLNTLIQPEYGHLKVLEKLIIKIK